MKELVTDQDVEKAIDFLRHQANAAAEAKAHRIYMTEFRKVVKAKVMQRYINTPHTTQERNAYSDPEYIAHLDAMKTAIERDIFHEWKRAAAEATIEAWRTHNANVRGERKLG
jgi:plasmid stabilization system protein ParE